jgi:MFS family permease
LLRRPGYRRLWLARTASQVGDVAQFTTLGLLLLALTGSGLGVSGGVVAEVLPVLLVAPLAGSLVDRLPRVPVMVAADAWRAVLAAVLAVWHGEAGVAYGVAFGLSAGSVFFNPAAQSVLPALVDDEELVAANSGIWTAAVTCQVLLAPVAGYVAAAHGFGPAFTLNAVSFVVSGLLLLGLRVPAAPRPVTPPSVFAHVRAGLAALAGVPLLRALALGQLLAALSAGATSALLVVLAAERLGGGAGFGVLLAGIAVGAIAGPQLLRRVAADPRRPLWVFGPYAVRGLVDLALSMVTVLPLAAAAVVFYGLATSTGNVTFSSLIQSRVPEELRGRAFAGFDVIWQTGRLVSLLAGGLLLDVAGVRVVYVLGATLLLLAAAVGGAAAVLTGPSAVRSERAEA